MELPQKLLAAVDQFRKIPGIGEKTALRQCLGLTKWKDEDLLAFGQAIMSISDMAKCQTCGMLCDEVLCEVCQNPVRFNSKVMCIVENISDCLAIEKSENFQGKYHILGGVLNPLLGIGPDELNLDKLQKRVIEEEVESIILALNPSVEGDATCAYIQQLFDGKISVERIGFGIPIGGSLEYVDSMTITKALENRKRMT